MAVLGNPEAAVEIVILKKINDRFIDFILDSITESENVFLGNNDEIFLKVRINGFR